MRCGLWVGEMGESQRADAGEWRGCSVPGCRRRHRARGWCLIHYLRWWRYGDPTTLKRRTPRRAVRDHH